MKKENQSDGNQGAGNNDRQLIEVASKHGHREPVTVLIKPGENGGPGVVLDVKPGHPTAFDESSQS